MQKFSANPVSVISIFFIMIVGVFSICGQDASNNSTGKSKVNAANENAATVQTDTPEALDEKNEVSVLGAIAPRGLSSSRKSTFGFAAVRYSRRIATGASFAIKYQIDFIPVALINYDKIRTIQTAPTTFVSERERTTVYGAGLTPVSFQLNLRRKKKVQPFIGLSAGLIVFAKIIPDDRSVFQPERFGTRLNFATAAGGGVEVVTDSNRSYTVGYKYNHISNASRGNINPGFNQNLFYLGYTFKKW